jgi:AmiR/NasT family two-component response regulator
MVLLTAHNTPEAIGKAIRAGINACVAGCSEPGRIGHLL